MYETLSPGIGFAPGENACSTFVTRPGHVTTS
jgi:hypothetical protein